MKLEFTYASEEDLSKIVATYNSTIPSRLVTADLEAVSVESKKAWFDAHSPSKRPLWLIYCNQEYAGWMSFSSFYGRPAYDGTVEISIYLEDAFKGRGIGKACLNKAFKEAPSFQIHTLLGFIFGHNAPSLNLFLGSGFEKWGHLPAVANMNGQMRDLLILGKKL